jgi:hypothetical protein
VAASVAAAAAATSPCPATAAASARYRVTASIRPGSASRTKVTLSIDRVGRRRPDREVGVDDRQDVAVEERQPAGQQLEQRDAERVASLRITRRPSPLARARYTVDRAPVYSRSTAVYPGSSVGAWCMA